MGENSKIEWTDHTFNPWIGCTKVSPACENCYAEALMDNRYGRVRWGAGEDRSRTASSTWRQPRKWNRDAIAEGTRPFVFCASLADVFDNEVDPEWRADLFALIETTPALVWLLLTKRIGNVMRMMDNLHMPRNVAIGATMANQGEYDRDRMKLAEVRFALHPIFTFGSFEPMLGSIILDKFAPDWVIVGGESGSNARPMQPEWSRSLQRQSRDLGLVFNFKQVGGRGADKGGHLLDGVEYFARPAVPPIAVEQAACPPNSPPRTSSPAPAVTVARITSYSPASAWSAPSGIVSTRIGGTSCWQTVPSPATSARWSGALRGVGIVGDIVATRPLAKVFNPRWAATVHYRVDAGLVDITHDLEEIEDLQELVEAGPHFDTIDKITIVYVMGAGVLTVEEAASL